MFVNDLDFLSNMYPVDINCDDIIFKSSEHLYQFLKVDDTDEGFWWKQKIIEAPHGKVAKKLVHNVKCPLKKNWKENRIKNMKLALELKFQDPILKQKLIDTYPEMLVEHNNWNDTYWGVCNGKGKNNLGKLLMELRNKLLTTLSIEN